MSGLVINEPLCANCGRPASLCRAEAAHKSDLLPLPAVIGKGSAELLPRSGFMLVTNYQADYYEDVLPLPTMNDKIADDAEQEEEDAKERDRETKRRLGLNSASPQSQRDRERLRKLRG